MCVICRVDASNKRARNRFSRIKTEILWCHCVWECVRACAHVPQCTFVVRCSFIWESTSLTPFKHPLNSENAQPRLERDNISIFFHLLRLCHLCAGLSLRRKLMINTHFKMHLSLCLVPLGPAKAACTSLWPRLRAVRACATRWIKAAAFSPISLSWSTTTAHTDCLSLEQSTWPCSILCPGHTEDTQRKTHSDTNTHTRTHAQTFRHNSAQART